jgi:hypothetical protein
VETINQIQRNMRIENGKWVDQYGDPVTVFNFNELKEIGEKVTAVYGDAISYNRIELISSIKQLSEREESSLAQLLTSDIDIAKLAGY